MSEPQSPVAAHTNPGRRRGLKLLPAFAAVVLVGLALFASRGGAPTPAVAEKDAKADDPATAKAVSAANKFLEALAAPQRDQVLFKYDSPRKPKWSNLPVTMVKRNGLPLGELTKAQRAAALDVVAAVLNKEGYQKVLDIMHGDDLLVQGNNKNRFGEDNYYLALFGKPSPTEPWMVQFGGHHLGVNVTVVGKARVLAPTHTGAQPTKFDRDGKTVRPLGPENDLAFRLINMLDEKQQGQAVRGKRPRNLALGPGEDGKTIEPEGIKGSDLSEAQRGVLLELIGAWVKMLPEDAAARRLAEIKGKLADTYLAWYGPTENGSAVYYRVQGPTVVIEYAPQGGTNHIHTIIRDPGNDYGKKLTAP
jgi:hypothetical protein